MNKFHFYWMKGFWPVVVCNKIKCFWTGVYGIQFGKVFIGIVCGSTMKAVYKNENGFED